MAIASMITAGRTGTPDWQLDNMIEAEAAQAWENQSAARPLAGCDYDSINNAWAALETMRISFNLLEDHFATATRQIEGTPEADKLASIFDQLSDLATEVRSIQSTLKDAKAVAFTERRYAG